MRCDRRPPRWSSRNQENKAHLRRLVGREARPQGAAANEADGAPPERNQPARPQHRRGDGRALHCHGADGQRPAQNHPVQAGAVNGALPGAHEAGER